LSDRDRILLVGQVRSFTKARMFDDPSAIDFPFVAARLGFQFAFVVAVISWFIQSALK
jgi:hypothetical protein